MILQPVTQARDGPPSERDARDGGGAKAIRRRPSSNSVGSTPGAANVGDSAVEIRSASVRRSPGNAAKAEAGPLDSAAVAIAEPPAANHEPILEARAATREVDASNAAAEARQAAVTRAEAGAVMVGDAAQAAETGE